MITIKTKDQKGEEDTGRGELNNVKLTNDWKQTSLCGDSLIYQLREVYSGPVVTSLGEEIKWLQR